MLTATVARVVPKTPQTSLKPLANLNRQSIFRLTISDVLPVLHLSSHKFETLTLVAAW